MTWDPFFAGAFPYPEPQDLKTQTHRPLSQTAGKRQHPGMAILSNPEENERYQENGLHDQ